MNVARFTQTGAHHSSGREKPAVSKWDLKKALVAKRLAMLQDDHETEIYPATSLSPSENPFECESTKPSKGINIDDDTVCDDIGISKSQNNRTKVGSRKRAKVISDDEDSSEDRLPMAWIPPQKKQRTKKKRVNDLSNNENVKATDTPRLRKIQTMDISDPLLTAVKRAEEVQANLSPEHPSFVKLMLKSHVSGGFWLGLPKKFCNEHLPICDSIVKLVDEAGKESNTIYLAGKTGLSGGWRGFSIDHNLVEGDALVFQLISCSKFQIYIVREKSFGEVDGALGILTWNPGLVQQKSVCDNFKTEVNNQKVIQTEDNCNAPDYVYQSNSDVELGTEVLDGICFSDSEIKFEAVKCFEEFHIVVDGLIIDSKFSSSTRKKYYELCHSQRSFLHENIVKGLNYNLIVGIISETINIADAIKSCKKATTSQGDLQTWEKTLKGFKLIGMKVDFLCARINRLLGITVESNTADESNKLKECVIKQALAGERMKALEMKLTMANEWKQKARIKEITAA